VCVTVEISDELQRHWHGDPALIGRHIEVNNIDVVVAGILPRGFGAARPRHEGRAQRRCLVPGTSTSPTSR
jgi:hypothetical protein